MISKQNQKRETYPEHTVKRYSGKQEATGARENQTVAEVISK